MKGQRPRHGGGGELALRGTERGMRGFQDLLVIQPQAALNTQGIALDVVTPDWAVKADTTACNSAGSAQNTEAK